LRKIVVTFLATFVLTLSAAIVAAGYYVGNYLVGFGLMRGSADNPQAPPRAYALLMPPGTWNYTRPDAPSEEWRLISSDGLHLTATHFRSERPRGNWAIIVHGYGCTQENSYYLASHYLAQGYDVLTPDLRSSGKSEGRFVTMGLRESGDIVGWAQEIAARNPEARIVLHGVSMGAATVMMAGASDALPVQVAAVVEDCGYTSAYDLLAYQMEISFRLPSFPGMNLLDWRCRSRAGFSLREAAPIEAVRHARVPMLFIHGTADTLVPASMAEKLYAACTSEKELLLVPEAIHSAASQKDAARYDRTVMSFLHGKMH
jgi:fermentation-respiration switch protein FrsA (DUF1100 family)